MKAGRGTWIAGGVLLLALAGYTLLLAAGENPPELSPFADIAVPEPSCPVLVLTNEQSDNPFGSYLAEILRAEGLNCFRVASISVASESAPEKVDTVLLAEGPLSTTAVVWLGDLVERGGRLIAMRPDLALAPVFGIEPEPGQTADGYLAVAGGHPLTAGIAAGPLQFRGAADHYRAAGADVVGWISADASGQPAFPGITFHRYGKGTAIAWSFDLARSVTFSRQGDPAWGSRERNRPNASHADNGFRGWLDAGRLPVPQADEQQRLLANMIDGVPRLWYFPGTEDGMLIATGDAPGSSAGAIEEVLAHVERLGGHMSIYYHPPPSSVAQRLRQRVRGWVAEMPFVGRVIGEQSRPSPAAVARWRARGHEFALHPDLDDLAADWREFTGLGYGPVPPTVRARGSAREWVESARAQASHGFRMTLDGSFGRTLLDDASARSPGYFTGSGLPMRLIDEHGRLLSIYQQATQLVDEDLIELPWKQPWPTMTPQAAVALAAQFLQRAPYTAVAAQFHVEPFAPGGQYTAAATEWLSGTLGAAAAEGFPIWSAEQWLRFTDIRDNAVFDAVRWDEDAHRLFFRIRAESAADVGLTVLVPLQRGTAKLARMDVDDQEMRAHLRRVGGITYGGVSVAAGTHTIAATYAD